MKKINIVDQGFILPMPQAILGTHLDCKPGEF